MKRFIKHFLMLCLFGMISIGVNAEEIPNNEIWYTSNDGKIVTPYYSGVFGANIVSNTYENGQGIIKFNGNVTSIYYAFFGCSGLTSVTIPNSVTSIGREAFYYCSGLTSVTIPNSVTSIGREAFYYCSGLTSIAVESGNKVYDSRNNCNAIIETASNTLISGCKNTTIPNSVTSIENYAFSGCSGLTSVTIPESVTIIGNFAFSSCTGLTSVNIPGSVTLIGCSAFSGCSGLTSVEIPNSVTQIADYAFDNCSGLTSVTIPNSVTEMGYKPFRGCYFQSGKFVNKSSLNAEFNDYWGATICDKRTDDGLCIKDNIVVRYGGNGTSVTIPNYVTSIGDEAFSGCSGLTSVTIPNSVTSIGKSAFEDCSGLTSVNITDLDKWAEIEFEGNYANPLYYAHSLYLDGNLVTEAKLETAKKIGSDAFSGCLGLTSVTIGNSVTKIGDDAFYHCDNVKELIYTEGTKTVLRTYLTSITSVTIPNSVTEIGSSAFNGCSELTSVTIPNSVTSIGSYAFEGCSKLTSVTIPNSVTSIESSAFSGCSGLTSVTIPYSVTSIGFVAFSDCSGLTSVTIPNSVTEIGDYAFSHCSGLTSVTIGNSVTSMGNDAFYGCDNVKELIYTEGTKTVLRTGLTSITSVTIPNSVTSIGSSAFSGCSGLTNVIADGINAPTIGSYCFKNVTNCYLHVPSGSERSYAYRFGTYFESGNTYGNTIVPYSSYSRNSAGEYSFETWDASSDVVLREGAVKVYVPVEAEVKNLQYKRTFSNTDWQALYVPFELDVENDLANFDVYEVSTSSADAINVTLMTEGKTSANTPYLIKAKATGEKTIPVSSKTVEVTEENTNSDLSDFEIVGTYKKLNYGDIDGDWYALKGGKFMKAGEGAYLNPYRFYLKRKSSSSKESIDINFDEPTGIETLQSADKSINNGKHYNMQGIEVNENYNGIIIINGKKYLKK